MVEFEGEINPSRETSEFEVNGKFKLTHGELDEISGSGSIPGFVYKLPNEALCVGTLVKDSEKQTLQPFGSPAGSNPDEGTKKGPLDLEGQSLYRNNFGLDNQLKWGSFDL